MKQSRTFLEQEQKAIELGVLKVTYAESQSTGKCVYCGEVAAGRIHSPEGQHEFRISGMCEVCFDGLFADEE